MGVFWGFVAGLLTVPALQLIGAVLRAGRVQRLDIHTKQRRQQMAQGRM